MSMQHAVIRRQSFLQFRFASERACGSLSNTSNVPKGQLQYAPLSRTSTCTKEVLVEEPLSAFYIADAAELSARSAFPVPVRLVRLDSATCSQNGLYSARGCEPVRFPSARPAILISAHGMPNPAFRRTDLSGHEDCAMAQQRQLE